MITYIWSGMIILSVICSIFTGNMQNLSEGILDSAREAIDLAVYMAGIVGLWTGMMKAAESIGFLKKIEQMLLPAIHFLFPGLKNSQATQYIATNMATNILPPFDHLNLLQMKCLQELNGGQNTASVEMCTFLILNISSLQLIPVNIIAYRAQYGSVDPTAIVAPGIGATAVSTGVAIVFCRWMQRK